MSLSREEPTLPPSRLPSTINVNAFPRKVSSFDDVTHSLTISTKSKDKRRLLIVDDDKGIRLMVSRWLKDQFEVLQACTGDEALEMLAKNGVVDLILCDVTMPGVDGLDFVKILRKKQFAEENFIPVILMSVGEHSEQSIVSGSQDFLTKPITSKLLIQKINTLLELEEKKRTEKVLKQMLEKERLEKENITAQVRDLSRELDALTQTNAKARALDTPLDVSRRRIVELLSASPELATSQLAREIHNLLGMLGNQDSHLPQSFESLNLDEISKSYLTSEFRRNDESLLSKPLTRRQSLFEFPAHSASLQSAYAEEIRKWSFDAFAYPEGDLLLMLETMFDSFNFPQQFAMDAPKFRSFLIAVRNSYHKNPYHNFRHAFDVTQTIYAMLTTFGASNIFTPLETFALLLSALCHDVEHPGTNNAFLVSTKHEIAITYNDQSVLENHHCATCFRLLRRPELNFLEKMDDATYKELRKLVVDNILATDNGQHSMYMSRFQQRADATNPLNPEEPQDRHLLLRLLMKAADISNVTKPWPVAQRWFVAVADEFFNQGDQEKHQHMIPAPFMDRTKSTAAKVTSNFIDFVASPLWQVVLTLLPASTPALSFLASNRKALEQLLKEGKDIVLPPLPSPTSNPTTTTTTSTSTQTTTTPQTTQKN